ncbi:hypothetical protein [Persicitalea jodogahamensis]|uniref:Uncharacterized protein n=1 Tax=Persicitalea jodogahamensis TaxID=402147 RepID=A0A8J3G8N3_9BACT|nr:hypothetical protein [Persicitalea jodogahamensis]GHB66907.1 hypothetical protein GCM10007390_20230 [Persicitalea jodogahamensis]
MPGSLNSSALNQYAVEFTTKILDEIYGQKTVVNGQNLLTLTPVRQVNLGVVSLIFDKWKAEAQAFRSPYFDFEQEEVKNALQEFMNTVSRHIAVQRDDLQPLLLSATKDALLLLLAPGDYFGDRLRNMPGFTFNTESAQHMTKYTHIHAGVAKGLALRLADSGSDFVYANQALNWLAETMDSGASLDHYTTYIEQFSSVKPLDVSAISPNLIVNNSPVEAPAAEPQKQDNQSFFDTALVEVETENEEARPLKPEAVPAIDISRESSMAASATTSGDSNGAYSRTNSLNNRFKVDMPAPSSESTYGNVSPKVDSIMGSIALGQRFMFVNQLFDRNSDAFDQAIHELDRASTLDEAQNIVKHKLATKYSWDENSPAASDLMAIIKRKFN